MGKTTVCHVDETFDVYVGRSDGQSIRDAPGQSWGNPYNLDEHSRGRSVSKFADLLVRMTDDDPDLRLALAGLHGKRLGCHCRRSDEDAPVCHGDVLAAQAGGAFRTLFSDHNDPCPDPEDHAFRRWRGKRVCVYCGYTPHWLRKRFGQGVHLHGGRHE